MIKRCLPALLLVLVSCARPREAVVERVPSPTSAQNATCAARFASSNLCVTWVWETEPTASTKGTLLFKIFRANVADGSPVLMDVEGDLGLTLWMPDMGHGSSPTKTVRVDVGTFRSSDVYFIMPGHWELQFELRREGAVTDEAVAPFVF